MNGSGPDGADPAVVVREARPADADAVTAFTRDTWGERHEDYIQASSRSSAVPHLRDGVPPP